MKNYDPFKEKVAKIHPGWIGWVVGTISLSLGIALYHGPASFFISAGICCLTATIGVGLAKAMEI